ncbi:MAG: metal-dependent transcriptional regulator [Thermoplasmata archaeon]
MERDDLTQRDGQYLKAVYVLGGREEAVGPAMLARRMDVSRVGALKKMRRLTSMGYGEYLNNKGFLLNEAGIQAIQTEMRRHHVIEKFLQISLEMESEKACDESSRVGQYMSRETIDNMSERLGDELTCECGCCIEPPYEPEDLMHCHWVRKQMKVKPEG